MNAIDLLKNDHATVTDLFERYKRLGARGDTSRKQELARQVLHELSIHAAIEEQILYPSLKARDSRLEERINQALEEHRVAKWELAALERMSPEDARFDARFAVLAENVRLHVEQEEKELFALTRRLFNQEELEGLGDALALAKRAAPTHPHPNMPDEPPGNVALAPVMAVMDRGRDLLALAVVRGMEWLQETGRKLRGTSEELVDQGRERAEDLSEQAQRWTQVAPARALETSSDVLAQARVSAQRVQRQAQATVDEVLDETRDTAHDTARQARVVAQKAERKTAPRKARATSGSVRHKTASASPKTAKSPKSKSAKSKGSKSSRSGSKGKGTSRS